MVNKIRSFSDWTVLYEGKDNTGNKAKEALSTLFGDVLYVPNFINFKRDGEPNQVSHLFGDKLGNNFSFNYTETSGELFSVDLYPKGSTKSTVTLYANGADEKQMAEALNKKIGKKIQESKNANTDTDDVVINYKDGHHERIQMPSDKKNIEKNIEKTTSQITEVKPPKQKLKTKDESIDYEYGDPKTIFKDLEKYTEMVAKTIQPGLLVCGSAGVGKSFKINKTLAKFGFVRDKDYFVIKGKATAAGMYIKLFENNGKLTMFDDCDSVFDDENGVNILKGALDSDDVREISWTGAHPIKSPTTGQPIPASFVFTGQAIFVTNRSKKSLGSILAPIKSRTFVIEVALSPEDMVEYIKELLPTMMKEEPMSLKNFAFRIIQSVAKQNPEIDLNLRTMIKAIKIVKYIEDLDDAKRMIAQQCVE